jgi:hypothetical protein
MGMRAKQNKEQEEMDYERLEELKNLEKKEKEFTRKLRQHTTFENFKWEYENILKEIDNKSEYEYMKVIWKVAKKIAAERGWRII